jgi:POT family proton-dependent oligopeptide transporter
LQARSLNKPASGMTYLYITQALCNFGFYGIKSIFVLYAIQQLNLDKPQAIALFATFMTLCYATSLIGGTIADRVLGIKNTVLMGGLLTFTGLLSFTFSSPEFCYLGLAFMSLGSGFFKPNLSTSVGLFFENPKDPQKDRAYSHFYMAMNVGSLLAPLVCGLVSMQYGWNYGILLIAGGFLGATYLFNQKVHFGDQESSRVNLTFLKSLLLGIPLGVTIVLFYGLFKYRDSFHGLMGIIAVSSVIYLGRIYYQCNALERKDVRHIMGSILLFAFFCSLFEQSGSSLLLFFDTGVDRTVFGRLIPSSAFLSLSPLFVLILSPILLFLFKTYFEKTKPLDGFFKIGLGFVFVGVSFLLLSYSSYQEISLVSPIWVVLAVSIQTIGELLVVPIVLSNISKYSPPRFRSVMMSYWLMAIAYGHYFAGFIAQFSVGTPLESSANALERYGSFFFSLGLMPLCVAVLLLGYQGMRRLR